MGARSLVIWDSQVSGGLPTGRLWGVRWYCRAFCAGVSGWSRRMWPKGLVFFFEFLTDGGFFGEIVEVLAADLLGVSVIECDPK